MLKEDILDFPDPWTRVPEEEVVLRVPQDRSSTRVLHAPTDQGRSARYVEIVRIRPASVRIPNTDVLRLAEELVEDVLGTLRDLGRRYQNGICHDRY